MNRTLLVCAALLAAPVLCRAQGRTETVTPTETIVRLKVKPAPAPKPALKYQLLPELGEMHPGNPILGYLRCFSEQNHFFFSKEAQDERDKWGQMPLKDLPAAQLRNYGGVALRRADEAARLETPDWQTLRQLRRDGVRMLLSEVQQMRLLTNALHVRFRGEVADGRFDDALVTAKTMFALSRHMAENPTVIGGLVGIAMANIAVHPLEEMLGQPGCPNLFWALTDLPHPLIDLRKPAQGERLFLDKDFAGLDTDAPMTEGQLGKAAGRLSEAAMYLSGEPAQPQREFRAWLEGRAKDEGHIRAARKRLVEAGLAAEAVKQFPPLQVVLLDEKVDYEARRDDILKALRLPYWQAEPILAGLPKKGKGESLFASWGGGPKVAVAQARVEQRLALLRCVEALRLHAAEHGGKLPAKLDDVKLPLPVDPVTGRPFVYSVEGATATLRGTPPRGMEKSAPYNVRYEVTIIR
jgi:hypothetical protein